MIARLIASWTVLAFLVGFNSPEVKPLPDVDKVAMAFAGDFPKVEARTEWVECGEPNAFYVPAVRVVYLCTELVAWDPGVVRMIYAHELAHAVIDQLEAPITGLEELAADELALWMFLRNGWRDDVFAYAKVFIDMHHDENPMDEHPSDLRRAAQAMCLEMQSRGVGALTECRQTDWKRVDRVWSRLLPQ